MELRPDQLEILSNSTVHICREMGIVMQRASLSIVFSMGLDFSCAMFDGKGRMISQAENIPGHIASLRGILQSVLSEYDASEIRPGDVFASNDAYLGGMQPPDLCVMKPIFFDGKLVAFAGNTAHHTDVGGMSPGSLVTNGTEVYQEGLQIPPVKIVNGGNIDKGIVGLIERNIRLPRDFHADLNAQMASVATGERRLNHLISGYGLTTFHAFTDEIISYSERRIRRGIGSIPSGTFFFSDYVDNDGVTLKPLQIKVGVTVDRDEIICDFTDSPRQAKGPINCPYHQTVSACVVAIKVVVDPHGPPNEGMFKPIKVIAPEGSLVNPKRPAPVAAGTWITGERITAAIWGAIGQAVPARVAAGPGGSANDVFIFGRDPAQEDLWILYDYFEVGWGARPNADGQNAFYPLYQGNPENNLAEIHETRYPIMVKSYSLREGSGGAGKYRGGLGVIKEFSSWPPADLSVTVFSDRARYGAHGLLLGKQGKPAVYVIESADGHRRPISPFLSKGTSIPLMAGEVLRLESPGGGGYGDPFERNPDLVVRDVVLGYISKEQARIHYGVIINDRDGSLDPEATRAERLAKPEANSNELTAQGPAAKEINRSG